MHARERLLVGLGDGDVEEDGHLLILPLLVLLALLSFLLSHATEQESPRQPLPAGARKRRSSARLPLRLQVLRVVLRAACVA
jgi:hypothetical protein